MRRLILIRHAKSSWDDPAIDDFDRPLNARGKRSAKAIGEWLSANGYRPHMLLSSSAQRTAETALLLDTGCDPIYSRRLYHADANDILSALKLASGDTVALIGHNPGIGWFARSALNKLPDHARFHDYPTCATLVADFEIGDWQDLRAGTGTPVAFIVPRDLE